MKIKQGRGGKFRWHIYQADGRNLDYGTRACHTEEAADDHAKQVYEALHRVFVVPVEPTTELTARSSLWAATLGIGLVVGFLAGMWLL